MMAPLLKVAVVLTTATLVLTTDDTVTVGSPVQTVIYVAPFSPIFASGGALTPRDGSLDSPLQSLQDAADRVAALLRTPSAKPLDVVVTLQPGAHRVPSGGKFF